MEKEMKARIREINSAMRKYGFGKALNRTIKEKILPSKEDEYDMFLDPELAVNLRLMFQELGTSFIKLGQLLALGRIWLERKLQLNLKSYKTTILQSPMKKLKE